MWRKSHLSPHHCLLASPIARMLARELLESPSYLGKLSCRLAVELASSGRQSGRTTDLPTNVLSLEMLARTVLEVVAVSYPRSLECRGVGLACWSHASSLGLEGNLLELLNKQSLIWSPAICAFGFLDRFDDGAFGRWVFKMGHIVAAVCLDLIAECHEAVYDNNLVLEGFVELVDDGGSRVRIAQLSYLKPSPKVGPSKASIERDVTRSNDEGE